MKIIDSNIQMSAVRTYAERDEQRESLTIWRDADRAQAPAADQAWRGAVNDERGAVRMAALSFSVKAVEVSISSKAKAMQPSKAIAPKDDELETGHKLEVNLIKLIVEKLTSKKIKLMQPSDLHTEPVDNELKATGQQLEHHQESAGDDREGWGMVYDYYESHYEAESTRFSAEGVIHTADGKEVSFDVDLSMSREFMTQQSLSIRAGDALKDPLVINFDGRAAELTQTHFSFDLDIDGKEDQIAFVGPGSGFLALDNNADGVINNGSELFGPTTGEGFLELARYDEDGNQWIDESDSIYNQLRIWSKDAEGNDHLIALGQKDIGAIYLGHIETPFLLKDEDNELAGAVRSSGIYVHEDGEVGTVQQVDLVV